jgi:ribonuclease T1
VAVLLVLALVAVLVGLVGAGGSGAVPVGTGASARPTSGGSPGAARTTPTRRPSPSTTRSASPGRDAETGLRVVALGSLPREAQATVALIDAGGPFPYSQDGVTFGNLERLLPAHPRGWYREYTVRTPGERDRGPRRIVTGDDDRVIFYTADHYGSFVRVAR